MDPTPPEHDHLPASPEDQSLGSGNYTRDRHQWLPDYKNAEELFADIEATKKKLDDRGETK